MVSKGRAAIDNQRTRARNRTTEKHHLAIQRVRSNAAANCFNVAIGTSPMTVTQCDPSACRSVWVAQTRRRQVGGGLHEEVR